MSRAVRAGRPARPGLEQHIKTLGRLYGEPPAPGAPPAPLTTHGPFAMVLWENVAYLQTDERRDETFGALHARAGITPAGILAAPMETLLEVATMGGMRPRERVERLRRIAEIALHEFDGDLSAVLGRPLAQARRDLMRFPGIGEPAAEKILVFCGAQPLLALDSNGLRVLLRLGFGEPKKSYRATYRCVQTQAMATLPARLGRDCAWLARAHLLLRLHGKRLCRTAAPRCEVCPLSPVCPHASDPPAR